MKVQVQIQVPELWVVVVVEEEDGLVGAWAWNSAHRFLKIVEIQLVVVGNRIAILSISDNNAKKQE